MLHRGRTIMVLLHLNMELIDWVMAIHTYGQKCQTRNVTRPWANIVSVN